MIFQTKCQGRGSNRKIGNSAFHSLCYVRGKCLSKFDIEQNLPLSQNEDNMSHY